MKNLFSKVLLMYLFCCAAIQSASAQETSTISALDYGYGSSDAPTVKVGTQLWLGKNLNVDHFANGDPIPEAKTKEEWIQAGENHQPAWCYFNNDPANGPIYGRLYNWYAVHDQRGLVPNGWHVPNDYEWDILIRFLAGKDADVNKPTRMGGVTYYFTADVGTSMKSTTGWKKNKGTNSSGLAFLGGGNRLANGPFDYLGEYGSWWSSSEEGLSYAWYRGLYFANGRLNRFAFDKHSGFSVRCIKD